MRVDLHIDRLVLDEAVIGDERPLLVKATLERDLMRLLAAPGTPDALRAVGVVDTLRLAPLPAPTHRQQSLGARVAVAVAQALGVSPTQPSLSTRGGTRQRSRHAAPRQHTGPAREDAARCRR